MLDQNEIDLFRDNVRKFLEKEVQPHYDQWEKDEKLPRELWNRMGENGLLCVDVPEQYGGFGADFRLSAVMVEEASRMGFGALASNLSVHSDIVAPTSCTWAPRSRNRPGCRKWSPAKRWAPSA
ncbi:Acyl-CoA dehydrogenase [Alcanivorax sp. ALC70]|nr:Acyl-CoA dehydrogenase [Alcanivorax sp. ALC70]